MKKLLIANRGEIAVRLIRAGKELGIKTVAIFAKEDEFAVHRFKADESYLVGERARHRLQRCWILTILFELRRKLARMPFTQGMGSCLKTTNSRRLLKRLALSLSGHALNT